MKDRNLTMTLNEKGIMLIGVIILSMAMALGFMVTGKRKDRDVTIFTKDDLERIVTLQRFEDEDQNGSIYAYKDDDGRLMIGWSYDE